MKSRLFFLALSTALVSGQVMAQTSTPPQQPPVAESPQTAIGAGAGAKLGYPILAPAPVTGMSTNAPGGQLSVTQVPVNNGLPGGVGQPQQQQQFATPQQQQQQQQPSPYYDHSQVTQQQIDAFNQTMSSQMPMTPEMVRKSIALYDEVQRAMLERTQPERISDSGVLTLEPGEVSPTVYLSANIVTVLGFYDSTGQPWPIERYIIGNQGSFQVIPMGEGANSITLTPLVPVGFTNLVVRLEGEPKPVSINLNVSQTVAHERRDFQVTKKGPNAVQFADESTGMDALLSAARGPDGTPIRAEAGNKFMMTVVSGVDIPDAAKTVNVSGVRARAWSVGDSIFIRSEYPLVAPQPLNFLAGPDGVMVYEIKSTPTALFDVGGAMVRADIDMP